MVGLRTALRRGTRGPASDDVNRPLLHPAGQRARAPGTGAELHVLHGPHVIMHTDPTMIAGHIIDFTDEAA